MAGFISIDSVGSGFAGRKSMYEYLNSDSKFPKTGCGQCAVGSVLTSRNKMSQNLTLGLRMLEAAYPPDVIGGQYGTSPWRIRAMLKAYGINSKDEYNKFGMMNALKNKKFCIVLVQNNPGFQSLASHWFVVYGADNTRVYVTNWHAWSIKWSTFDAMWSAFVPTGAMMSRVSITC